MTAVIDPEDRQAVERLLSLVGDALNWGPHKMERLSYVEPFQAALREFAAPTPPRPNEPKGLGAVVEDADGELWIRGPQHNSWKWLRTARPGCENYADIDVVRVLSEGIEQP